MSDLYVVRCSTVGPERYAPQMSLADAQLFLDDINSAGHCKGSHWVEAAPTFGPNHPPNATQSPDSVYDEAPPP